MNNNKPLIAITGASSGIGQAAAEKFSKEGHPLLLMARRLEKMEAFNLPNCICKRVDVRHYEDVIEAIREAQQKYGPVDCLINSAGISSKGNFITKSPEQYKNMVEINLLGVLNGMHAVLKDMTEKKKGTIINIGSLAGIRGTAGSSIYAATKAAVHAISETIRQEVAKDNVRIIIIAPGYAETEMIRPNTEEGEKRFTEIQEMCGKLLSAEDIANTILFAYQQADHINIREITIAPVGEQR